MTVMERLANSIVVPVVVLDKVEDAIPTAKAMAAGGVDTMEITFRTACAPRVHQGCRRELPRRSGRRRHHRQPGSVQAGH